MATDLRLAALAKSLADPDILNGSRSLEEEPPLPSLPGLTGLPGWLGALRAT